MFNSGRSYREQRGWGEGEEEEEKERRKRRRRGGRGRCESTNQPVAQPRGLIQQNYYAHETWAHCCCAILVFLFLVRRRRRRRRMMMMRRRKYNTIHLVFTCKLSANWLAVWPALFSTDMSAPAPNNYNRQRSTTSLLPALCSPVARRRYVPCAHRSATLFLLSCSAD